MFVVDHPNNNFKSLGAVRAAFIRDVEEADNQNADAIGFKWKPKGWEAAVDVTTTEDVAPDTGSAVVLKKLRGKLHDSFYFKHDSTKKEYVLESIDDDVVVLIQRRVHVSHTMLERLRLSLHDFLQQWTKISDPYRLISAEREAAFGVTSAFKLSHNACKAFAALCEFETARSAEWAGRVGFTSNSVFTLENFEVGEFKSAPFTCVENFTEWTAGKGNEAQRVTVNGMSLKAAKPAVPTDKPIGEQGKAAVVPFWHVQIVKPDTPGINATFVDAHLNGVSFTIVTNTKPLAPFEPILASMIRPKDIVQPSRVVLEQRVDPIVRVSTKRSTTEFSTAETKPAKMSKKQ